MYEYKGEQVTPGDIQVYADKYEMSYDQALTHLLANGMKSSGSAEDFFLGDDDKAFEFFSQEDEYGVEKLREQYKGQGFEFEEMSLTFFRDTPGMSGVRVIAPNKEVLELEFNVDSFKHDPKAIELKIKENNIAIEKMQPGSARDKYIDQNKRLQAKLSSDANFITDQRSKLLEFMSANAPADAQKISDENRYKRKEIHKDFQEATSLDELDLFEINNTYADISVFDKQEAPWYKRAAAKVADLGLAGVILSAPAQPHQAELDEAAREFRKSNDPEIKKLADNQKAVKERALEILKENAIQEARNEKAKIILEGLEKGEMPAFVTENFSNLDPESVKGMLTVGSAEFIQDFALTSELLLNKEQEIINTDSKLKETFAKIEDPNYSFEIDEGEQTVTLVNGKVLPLSVYNEYAEGVKLQNVELKNLENLYEKKNEYAGDVKNTALQMDLLQKNYNDVGKFLNNTGLAFVDFFIKVGDISHSMSPEMEEIRIKHAKLFMESTQRARATYKDDVQFEDAFKNGGNFIEFFAHNLLANQLPIIASFAVAGPYGGAAIIGKSSFSEQYMDISMKDYANRDLAADLKQPYEMQSKLYKAGVSAAYALPEVVLDRLTTGAKVTGLKAMLSSSRRSILNKETLAKYIMKSSLNTGIDTLAGGVSEGATQIIQNIITGKTLTDKLPEAFVSGLLLDGALSSLPAVKGLVLNQLSDYDTYAGVREVQGSIDALIQSYNNTAYNIQNSKEQVPFYILDEQQRTKDQINELIKERDTEIAAIEAKVMGLNDEVGLSVEDSKIFFSARAKQESLRQRYSDIKNDNNISKKEKKKLLANIDLEFRGLEMGIQSFLKSNFENKRQWELLALNDPKTVNEWKEKARQKLRTNGVDSQEENINEEARVLYNTDLIEKNLSRARRNGKLDRSLTAVRNEDDLNNLITKLEEEGVKKKDIDLLIEGYKSGSVNGFNLSGVTKKGGSVIFIENMASNNRTEVRGHELFHELGAQAFKNDPNVYAGMATSILEWAKRNDKPLYNRLLNITEAESGIGRDQGKYKSDEVIAVFFEEVAANRVDLKAGKNRVLLALAGTGFAKTMKEKYNIDFDLAGVDDTMELIVGLAKKVDAGSLTMKDLKALSTNEQILALAERGKKTYKNFADQKGQEPKKSYQKTDRDKRLDTIGEKYTKEEWDNGGSDTAISDMYMSGDLEAIVRNNLSSELKNLPNYSEEDFISETIGELMPHISNFNIDRKETQSGFGLSGWIRGQINNKIGNVLKKKKATTETFTVDTTDEKVKETVESTDDLQDLQEEDLSVAAQTKKKAKAERREEKGMEEGVEYSTFRRALKVKGKQGLSDNIVDNVKQAVVKTMATERTTPDSDKFIANIKKSFLTELKKPIQDMMGKKDDFTNFLKTNREAIIAALPTSTLVQMERNVDPADRVFTVEVKRNLNPTETDQAIANDQLPKDTNRKSGPTLYAKRMPSEGEFLRYFSPPLYVPSKKDPNKYVRSGLKGTRKDTLAEQMGIELAFDATMEVVQSPEVAERRSLVTNTDFLETGVEQLAKSIGRGVDIKFSRSNPAEVRIKMDLALDNVNTDAYLDIRFSKSSRDAYIKRLVKNRPDLKGQEEQYVDSVFDWLETTDIKKRSKYEKMAMHYMAKGYLILPEDGYKVIEAERLAAIKKIDPFSVGNPNEIIEKYARTVKGARTNPDTVKEFSNKKDLGNGVVTYDVEQTKEGQLAVRKVIDTHFGKKSNPWCLASRDNRLEQAYEEFNNQEEADIKARELESQGYDVEVAFIESEGTYEVYGDLIAEPGNDMELDAAFTMWKKYQEGGKGYQIVFTNGKLSHFRDGIGMYWDKMDKSSKYIPKKLNDLKLEDGFTQERELNVNTGEEVLGKKTKTTGNRQDGTYTNITIENDEVGDGKVEQVTGFDEVYDRINDLEDSGYEVSDPEVVQDGDNNTTVYEIQYFDPRATLKTTYKAVELKEVRENGELTYENKLIKYPGESYGTETKYSGDSMTIAHSGSGPKNLKKGGTNRWELETTLDRAGEIAGVDLKLDEYTETTFVSDYKKAPDGSYDRVGSKHTVKGELNGKDTTIEIVDSVYVNKDSNITKVKVNGKTVYTAPKVDDTGIKFSEINKNKFYQFYNKIKRNGVLEMDFNDINQVEAFLYYAKRPEEDYNDVNLFTDVKKILNEKLFYADTGKAIPNPIKLEIVTLNNFINATSPKENQDILIKRLREIAEIYQKEGNTDKARKQISKLKTLDFPYKEGAVQVALKGISSGVLPDNAFSVFEEVFGHENKADSSRTPARTFFLVKNKTNNNFKVLINKPENLESQAPRKVDKLRKMMQAEIEAQDQIKVIESIIGREYGGTADKLTAIEGDRLKNDPRFKLLAVKVRVTTKFAAHDYLRAGKKKPIASSYITVGNIGTMTMGNADQLALGGIIPKFESKTDPNGKEKPRPMDLVMRQILEKSSDKKSYSIKFKVEGQMRANDKKKNGEKVFQKSPINFYIQEDVNRVVSEFEARRGVLKEPTPYRDMTPEEITQLTNIKLDKFMFSKSKYNSSKDPYSFVDFKTVPKEIVNSKSYKNWIKSLEGIKLFHGTVINPSDISKRGTNHSLNWFLVGGNNNEEAIFLAKNIERDFDGEPENSVLSIDASKLAGRILPDSDFIGPSDAMGISSEFAGKIQALEDKYKASTRVQSMIQIPAMYAEFLDIITEYNPMSGFSQTLFDKNGKLSVNTAVVVIGGLKPNQLKVESISDPKTAFKFSKVSKSKDKKAPTIKQVIAGNMLNKMIQRSKGIDSEEIISGAAARRLGKNKNPFQFFVPPSADDLSGLLYYLAGKGKQGDADLKFLKEFLLDPLGKGERSLATKKQQVMNDYGALNKANPEAKKKLSKLIPDSKYTYDTAVRVFLWNQDGVEIKDISNKEVGELISIVRNDAELQEYAQGLLAVVANIEGKYPEPMQDWIVGNTAHDAYLSTTKVGRKLFLAEFLENAEAMFNKDNMNKLTAAYGVEYTNALTDILYRIKTGENRPLASATDKNTNNFMKWVTNSTGAIMFFNTKSALLQTLSSVNYLNWSDNNPLQAGKAFANQKQFWSDFSMLFNSDMLKQRRSGLATDVQAAEIASAAAGAKNKASAVLAYMLKKGFLPTQIADSFAISAGGAAFYRNRVNSYLKQGMDKKSAEQKAFADFADITEENQQSSRPDRVSQQQASPLGRLILAFQNTPMQYNRIIKKSMMDLQAGRGDTKTHVSKIIYYAGVQAFIFAALQNALFAMLFEEDEQQDQTSAELDKKRDKEQLKYTRIVNSMIDGLLNGSGVKGRVISTVKNTILKFIEEDNKEWNANYTKVAVEAANISPPIGAKLRKISKAGENYGWNKKAIKEIGYDNYFNPVYVTAATFAEAATNVPLARAVRKLDNLVEVANQNNAAWQRIGALMGWSQWDLGIEGKRIETVNETKEAIKKRKDDKKKQAKKDKKAKEKRCSAIKSNGKRCKNMTSNKSGRCYAHD